MASLSWIGYLDRKCSVRVKTLGNTFSLWFRIVMWFRYSTQPTQTDTHSNPHTLTALPQSWSFHVHHSVWLGLNMSVRFEWLWFFRRFSSANSYVKWLSANCMVEWIQETHKCQTQTPHRKTECEWTLSINSSEWFFKYLGPQKRSVKLQLATMLAWLVCLAESLVKSPITCSNSNIN